MTLEHIIGIAETILLIVVVIQSQYILHYERGVHRIQSEREKERREWREQKRKQITKKSDKVGPDADISI